MKLANALPLVTGILGLGGGFVAGWFGRPTSRAPIGSAESSVVAPSGNLSKENAQKLIDSDYGDPSAVSMKCQWQGATKKSDREYRVFEDDMKCARALDAAGLLKVGKCVEEGCPSGCCWTSVLSAGKADFYSDGGLYFPCGSFKVGAVTSVATEGNKATIKYGREFTPDDALLPKIADCKIDKPAVGAAERTRVAVRDDSGAWALVK